MVYGIVLVWSQHTMVLLGPFLSHPCLRILDLTSLFFAVPLLCSNQGENVQLADIEKVELIYSNKGDLTFLILPHGKFAIW